MKKLLLACDDFLYSNNGRFYAASQEKYDFYQRYLRVFDKLRLVCRCQEESELKNSRVPLDADVRIEVTPVPMFHGPKEYAKLYFSVGRALNRVTEGCDAAILRIPSTVAIRVGKNVLRSKMPYACEVVYDAEDGWRGYTGISRLAWKRIDKQMRHLCSSANGVSCVTEKYLQQHYFSDKQGAFKEHYSSLALDKSFYSGAKSFPVGRELVIAHISNQVGEQSAKGHRQTIEAIKILKDRGVNVIVKFAGNDHFGGIAKFRKYAEDMGVANRVEFLGFLNREGINSLLSEADLYVMPTMAEGLPRVIIEAIAKGLPCITTPVSGNPELVDEHFLVDYYDTITLADKIEELTKDASLYEATSKANFERSWKYEASVLEKRRDDFYGKLKQLVK